jgi:hypothetical protein
MKTTVRALLVLSSLSLLHAEEAVGPKLPEGPLLMRVSAPSQWVMTTQVVQSGNDTPVKADDSSPATKPAKPPKPSVTTVTKDKTIILEKTINQYDATIEIWRTSGWAVMSANGSGWIVSPGTGNTFNRTDYSKADFAGFDWISLKNFSGNRDVMGKHCLVFKDKVITMDPQEIAIMKSTFTSAASVSDPKAPVPTFDLNSLKVDVEADIDDKTRLPVMLTYKTSNGTMTRSYVFGAADGSLSLPPKVQELLNIYQKQQRRMSVPIAPI